MGILPNLVLAVCLNISVEHRVVATVTGEFDFSFPNGLNSFSRPWMGIMSDTRGNWLIKNLLLTTGAAATKSWVVLIISTISWWGLMLAMRFTSFWFSLLISITLFFLWPRFVCRNLSNHVYLSLLLWGLLGSVSSFYKVLINIGVSVTSCLIILYCYMYWTLFLEMLSAMIDVFSMRSASVFEIESILLTWLVTLSLTC